MLPVPKGQGDPEGVGATVGAGVGLGTGVPTGVGLGVGMGVGLGFDPEETLNDAPSEVEPPEPEVTVTVIL